MQSLIPSGYFGSTVDNIVVLENFIKPEDLKTIYNYCLTINNFNSIPGDHWDNRVLNSSEIESSNKEVHDIIAKYQKDLKKVIEDKFSFVLGDRSPSIVIWRPGDGQAPHADKENLDGTPNMYPDNDVASLLYWNDDYEGGEIHFPNQEFQLKVKSGSAVFFPGDKYYLHGVTQVTTGKRFTSPAFWAVKSIKEQ
jgi:predicted 2-oxoglutarate/Fe(II)-dependent dioxygenase YbiX